MQGSRNVTRTERRNAKPAGDRGGGLEKVAGGINITFVLLPVRLQSSSPWCFLRHT